MNDVLLEARALRRRLGAGDVEQEIIRGIDLQIRRGEFLALTGPSGSGKSTLLYLLGVLDRPSGGEVLVAGEATSPLSDEARARLRNHKLGFVFQFHYLLPEFSALENVLIPQLKLGAWSEAEARKRAADLLGDLGLGDKLKRRPHQLSGGEQQRVAIARALACKPEVLLADEPTGNLDSANTENVFRILEGLVANGLTIVMVTHDVGLADRTNRRVHLRDGQIAAA